MALILIQGGIFPYALDRIKTFKGMPHFYQQKPEAHDFKAFFSKRMGISFEKDEAEEAVVIRVYHPRAQYMRTKPWHPSQVTVGDDTPQYMDFKFNIIINKEFEAQVLEFGKDIEVLEPLHFRERIHGILLEAVRKYQING